jgi:hypothetical protein
MSVIDDTRSVGSVGRALVRWGTAVLLLLAVVAGIYGRFADLGKSPFAVDEYYSAVIVDQIAETGSPAMPTGGYYTRAPIYHYVSAFSVALLGDGEFAYRLPAAVFGVLAVVAAFLYCRRLVGPTLAAAVAIAVLASSWEVEFSRFHRMYTLFQGVTLMLLLAVHKVAVEGRWDLRYAPHGILIVAALSHEMGILLSPLVFLPLLSPELHRQPIRPPEWLRFVLAGCLASGVCLAIFMLGHLRDLGVAERFPADFVHAPRTQFASSAFPFWGFSRNDLVNLSVALGTSLVLAGLTALGRYLIARKSPGRAIDDAVLALLLAATCFHLLVPAGALAFVVAARNRVFSPATCPRSVYVGLGAAAVIAVAWFAYALADPTWTQSVVPGDLPASLRQTFFGWPDLYLPVLVPWINELPGIAVAVFLAMLLLAYRQLRTSWWAFLASPTFIVVLMTVFVGVLTSRFYMTRYFFFIYPVMLCNLALALRDLALAMQRRFRPVGNVPRDALAAAAFLGVFAVSSDFNPGHLGGVSEDDRIYRTGRFAEHRVTWYPRQDVRSPAEFVNRARSGDLADAPVIIVNQVAASAYMTGDFATYLDRKTIRFADETAEHGRTHRWTGGRLLSTYDDVREYTAKVRDVFVIRHISDYPTYPFIVEDIWPRRLAEATRRHLSSDGRIEVVHVRLKAPLANQ